MRSVDEVLSLYTDRASHYRDLHDRMREVQRIYNNEASVDLPDMDRMEGSSAPNLLAQGVDQTAGRIASVVPMVTFSADEPGKRPAERRAATAQRVVQGWWQTDRLPMKLKQRARHLIAYGMTPTVIRWNPKRRMPTWHVRSPLETFPDPNVMTGTVVPGDVVFAYRRTCGWLCANGYEDQARAVMNHRGDIRPMRDQELLLLEYVDHDGTLLVVTDIPQSDNKDYYSLHTGSGVMRGTVLEWIPASADCMPVTVPARINLDNVGGQYDGMIGMYYQQAKLLALEMIAVEKGIFPDTYLVSRPGEIARFVDGPHDGRTGMVNVVSGGDIRALQDQPGYLTNPTIDRLERNQRVTAGIPAEFGGESGSNIRTGRRGDAVLSAVIDYPVSEAQEVLAAALVEENKAGIALAKKMAGDTPVTVYVGTGNQVRATKYKASDVFTHDEHVVSYPASGTDLNSLMIGLGQRVGMGTMSKDTAARLDPFIDNPESEHDQIIAEGLEQALVAGIQQQAASGQIPPATLAKVMMLVKTDRLELAEAMQRVTEDAVAAQQQEQQGMPTPEQVTAPADMAAMAGPQAASPIPGASPGQSSLGDLLSTLRRPAMTVRPMRGAATGAM